MKRYSAAVQVRTSRPARTEQPNVARESVHPVDRHVGQQIRIRRMQSNVSLGDLGAGIGVSLQQVQKYESGKNRVSASMLYELANCLKIPVSRFFEGLPDPETTEDQQFAEIDEKIAYISTAQGRRLIEDVLLLSPRVRSRVVALVSSLVDDELEEPK
ncbi:helix-turn-helix domain-containing protein [Rhizobium etli]|uniref:helix-turn-helix domain-containing protein n=1 Tax=Rhizobium etli TaxID=29449 RepID=UPI00059FD19B|nr:helix-turn-helix transcriptional regulator [Rhizobium etli]